MSQPSTPNHTNTATTQSETTPTSATHRRTSSILTPEQQSFLESRLNQSAINTTSTPTSSDHPLRTTSTQLEQLLNSRTLNNTNELYEAGIHKDDVNKVAPRLHTTKQTLQKNLIKSSIHEKLSNRPTIDELHGQGIYKHKLSTNNNMSANTCVLNKPDECVELSAADNDHSNNSTSTDTIQQLTQSAHQLNINNTSSAKSELQVQQELYQRRSKMFHLTRILLRAAVALYDAKLITLTEKGALKDLIVDSHPDVLACAEQFDLTNDSESFKTHLIQIAKLAATT